MNILTVGSGCGSVGRGIAFETRGPSFESSHWQHFKMNKLTFNCWNDKIAAGNGLLKKR